MMIGDTMYVSSEELEKLRMVPGKVEAHVLPPPATMQELADRAVGRAKQRLQVAAVEYAAALDRQAIIAASGIGERPITSDASEG